MKRVCALALVLLTMGTAPAADVVPSPAELQAKIDAAAGTEPSQFREVVSYTVNGIPGRTTTIRRDADRRVIDDEDGFHSEAGVAGGDHWRMNENGHVVIDAPDPGNADKETMTTTVTRVHEPIDAYVLATLDRRGYGKRSFVDPATGDVVRSETTAPTGKSVTVFSDFRMFGTRRLASHWTVHDERHTLDGVFTRESYAAGGVAAADVAMPVIAHPLVQFPSRVDRVVLPSTFLPDGHVIVRVNVGSRGLDFLLDTGASTITIDPKVAASLGLTVKLPMQSSENAGRYRSGAAILDAMTIGPLTLNRVVTTIVPMGIDFQDVRVVGLLGFDFLCESGISIDYEHKQVVAQRFGTYTPPSDPRTIALDVRFAFQQPMTSITIDGAIADRFVIDTGAVGPFMIFDYFTRHSPNAIGARDVVRPATLMGAGGRFDVDLVSVPDVLIGNVHFQHFEGYRVAGRTSYAVDQDGVIGPAFLRYFNVFLDYPDGKIYLAPNEQGLRDFRAATKTQ